MPLFCILVLHFSSDYKFNFHSARSLAQTERSTEGHLCSHKLSLTNGCFMCNLWETIIRIKIKWWEFFFLNLLFFLINYWKTVRNKNVYGESCFSFLHLKLPWYWRSHDEEDSKYTAATPARMVVNDTLRNFKRTPRNSINKYGRWRATRFLRPLFYNFF